VDACPHVAKQVMGALLQFDTTYLCRPGFLVLVAIQTKSRNQVDVKDKMHAAMSKTTPQLEILLQISHGSIILSTTEVYFLSY
jgi:hypothetical protein